jgi:hypothetical protein
LQNKKPPGMSQAGMVWWLNYPRNQRNGVEVVAAFGCHHV